MNNEEVFTTAYSSIALDLIENYKKPDFLPQYLAHYTSISNFESILNSNQIWFSHPHLMNDYDELKFGMDEGSRQFFSSTELAEACMSDNRREILHDAFQSILNTFYNDYAYDVYVFCASSHSIANTDGVLSMWRGYGNNCDGLALIFDLHKIGNNPQSAIKYGLVEYQSNEERVNWIKGNISLLSNYLKNHPIRDNQLFYVALAYFHRLRFYALFSKHNGFKEEAEIRFVYMKDGDSTGALSHMLDYHNGSNGVEPKFKLDITHIQGHTSPDLSLSNILHQIIVGPTSSTPLSIYALKKMCSKYHRNELADRVIASKIPYRSR